MCTALAFCRERLFGRTLDLGHSFRERVTLVPRRFALRFGGGTLREHYAMAGMASEDGDFPLFAEAVNERGLFAAGLNFPHSARYFPAEEGAARGAVAPHEVVARVLASCATADEAEALLSGARIAAVPYKGLPVAPLHWFFADGRRAFAAEPREGGLRLHRDPFGVLTNEPPFESQLCHLALYRGLRANGPAGGWADPPRGLAARGGEGEGADGRDSEAQNEGEGAEGALPRLGAGLGSFGLPGDASSPSRFVRAAFYAATRPRLRGAEGVSHFFHVLRAVAMVRGSVTDESGAPDGTRYLCCADGAAGVYYFCTCGNARLRAVRLQTEGEGMRQLDPHTAEDVLFLRP